MPDFAKATSGKHKPVLLHESIDALNLSSGKTFLDATYGAGGHTKEVKRRYPEVETIAVDRDPEVKEAIHLNFKDLDKATHGKVDAILFDLGLSSDQLEDSGRGFSFLRDKPLDMRMSKKGLTAADILNSWDESAIELVLRGFGEVRDSRRVAKEIVERRRTKPLATTFDLVEVAGERRGRIHPATKVFQAIRIAVNEELTSLEIGLEKGFGVLESRGRLAVISFHSLEDRIVKNFFRNKVREGVAKEITKKPITATEEEIKSNPRSRSAKLRVVEKK